MLKDFGGYDFVELIWLVVNALFDDCELFVVEWAVRWYIFVDEYQDIDLV